MNIARKTLILFIVLTVCFYFLTLGLLGKGGYMYNRSLKRILENLEYTSDLLKSDIESLKIRSDSLNTEEGIRDAALSLGYYVEGDTIYLFSTSEVQDPVPSVELEKEELHPFSAFSNLACLGIAAGISALLSLLFFLVKRPKTEEEDEPISFPDLNLRP